MGYRSDVMCIVYGDKDVMLATRAAERLRPEGIYKYFGDRLDLIENGTTQYLILRLEAVRWWDTYEDVKEWYAFMGRAAQAGLHYEFLRSGEDTEDVRHYTSPDAPERLLGIKKSLFTTI